MPRVSIQRLKQRLQLLLQKLEDAEKLGVLDDDQDQDYVDYQYYNENYNYDQESCWKKTFFNATFVQNVKFIFKLENFHNTDKECGHCDACNRYDFRIFWKIHRNSTNVIFVLHGDGDCNF